MMITDFLDGNAKKDVTRFLQAGNEGNTYNRTYPFVIQYLLKTYCKRQHLENALNSFTSCKQRADEHEEQYGIRLTDASALCGNVFAEHELITQFLTGFHPGIKALLSQNSQHLKFQYLNDAISAAVDAGDIVRETFKTAKSPAVARISDRTPRVPTRHKNNSKISAINNVQTSDQPSPEYEPGYSSEESQLLEEDAALQSLDAYAPSSPSDTSPVGKVEAAALTPQPGAKYRPPHIQRRNNYSSTPGRQTRRDPPICHTCYEIGHYSPDCPVDLPEPDDKQAIVKFTLIVDKNWQNLSPEQRESFITNGKSPSAVSLNNFTRLYEKLKKREKIIKIVAPKRRAYNQRRVPGILNYLLRHQFRPTPCATLRKDL